MVKVQAKYKTINRKILQQILSCFCNSGLFIRITNLLHVYKSLWYFVMYWINLVTEFLGSASVCRLDFHSSVLIFLRGYSMLISETAWQRCLSHSKCECVAKCKFFGRVKSKFSFVIVIKKWLQWFETSHLSKISSIKQTASFLHRALKTPQLYSSFSPSEIPLTPCKLIPVGVESG